ncbi:hypothetical protein FA13DRAFT_1137048 [Coprinellus micaceus]|uniref:Uncharacterized protein n=1 Tax=Coprinellus micaceus TaxID=71717 RepID=A0A4Y7RKQ0_COPMI|nr:hypothetical protein FA13DRAFT_1137048 [Coprinellus micaceus]
MDEADLVPSVLLLDDAEPALVEDLDEYLEELKLCQCGGCDSDGESSPWVGDDDSNHHHLNKRLRKLTDLYRHWGVDEQQYLVEADVFFGNRRAQATIMTSFNSKARTLKGAVHDGLHGPTPLCWVSSCVTRVGDFKPSKSEK